MCDQLLYCSKEIRPAKGMTERGWGPRRVQALPGSELCRFCLYAPKEIFFVSLMTPGVPGPQNSGLCSLAPPLSQLCLGLQTTFMLLYDDRQILGRRGQALSNSVHTACLPPSPPRPRLWPSLPPWKDRGWRPSSTLGEAKGSLLEDWERPGRENPVGQGQAES